MSREGQVYTVGMTAHIEAPADAVYALFTDYAHLDELSPALRETKLQARIDKTHARVYSLTHFCIWIFCTDIHQVQIMEKLPANGLRATTVPGGSDFSAGWIQWRFAAAQDDTTRVSFTSQFVPDFWVPPLIGPALIRHALRGQARLTLRGIERAYRRRAGRLSGPGLEASLARLNTISRQVQNADPLPSDPEVVEAP